MKGHTLTLFLILSKKKIHTEEFFALCKPGNAAPGIMKQASGSSSKLRLLGNFTVVPLLTPIFHASSEAIFWNYSRISPLASTD